MSVYIANRSFALYTVLYDYDMFKEIDYLAADADTIEYYSPSGENCILDSNCRLINNCQSLEVLDFAAEV